MSPNATESVIEQLKRTVPPPRTRAQAQTDAPAPPPSQPALTLTALEPAPQKTFAATPARAPTPALAASEERIAVRIPERKTQTARKRCSFDLDAALAEEFKVACVLAGVEMREVVASLVQGFVASHRPR